MLNKEKKKLLYKNGVTRPDLSNYLHGRLGKISKKKLKLIQVVVKGKIVSAKDFIPFGSQNKSIKKYLITYDLPEL